MLGNLLFRFVNLGLSIYLGDSFISNSITHKCTLQLDINYIWGSVEENRKVSLLTQEKIYCPKPCIKKGENLIIKRTKNHIKNDFLDRA